MRYSDDMPKVANLKETLHGPTTKQVIYCDFSIVGVALQLCCFPAVLLVLMTDDSYAMDIQHARPLKGSADICMYIYIGRPPPRSG